MTHEELDKPRCPRCGISADWHDFSGCAHEFLSAPQLLEKKITDLLWTIAHDLASDKRFQQLRRSVEGVARQIRSLCMEEAARVADECQRQNGPLAPQRFSKEYQAGIAAGAQAVGSAIRALATPEGQ